MSNLGFLTSQSSNKVSVIVVVVDMSPENLILVMLGFEIAIRKDQRPLTTVQ